MDFPPEQTAKVNRLTQVSRNQINITDETLNITVHSFSEDLREQKPVISEKGTRCLEENGCLDILPMVCTSTRGTSSTKSLKGKQKKRSAINLEGTQRD
jgi:hypothetical protein